MIICEKKEDTELTIKYVSRICLDLLLFSKDLDFKHIHNWHYLDVLGPAIKNSSIFSKEIVDLIHIFVKEKGVSLIPVLLNRLHEVYFDCFDKWKKGDII